VIFVGEARELRWGVERGDLVILYSPVWDFWSVAPGNYFLKLNVGAFL